MGKFCGKIGFAETVKTAPGIFKEQITERQYFGDVTRNLRRSEKSAKVNGDINISNEISIVADPYANENLYSMRYVVFNGVKWIIESAEVQYPRIILSIGGLYNENAAGTSRNA